MSFGFIFSNFAGVFMEIQQTVKAIFIAACIALSACATHTEKQRAGNCTRTEVQPSGMVNIERCVEWEFGPSKKQAERHELYRQRIFR
jgi:hypothetical protein